jgi:hypothetical protein
VTGVEPIEYESAGAAHVEESRGGWGETDSGAEFGGEVGHILWSGVIGVSMLRVGEKERQAERFAVSQVILSSEECEQISGPQRLKPQFL